MRGEFIKTGDLYVVHTPGVERPPTMRAAPPSREVGTLISTEPELTPATIDLLAATDGDPLRKFCCRQCGDCAPEELLAEGRFPDRISWLRHHYKEKHPGTWGKIGRMPETESAFKSGEIVRYKDERVRVIEHIGDRVNIWIPSRQESVWVGPETLERFEGEEIEFLPDSSEFLAFTIEDIGYREKLDKAFESAIARVKGG